MLHLDGSPEVKPTSEGQNVSAVAFLHGGFAVSHDEKHGTCSICLHASDDGAIKSTHDSPNHRE